ncbi:hypothetical protein PTSG_04366 [Salpingoeca rosetta]|uniref:Sulfotransferase domain-containing protein n=1 Tax=Salpingoeca rosetta (strain ATCC 50818 / BSB-021) TaxID=946362 RepID=F2U8C3_SALR5|nr:uncharacterized protein PTSG_04366 [Salpingoeca rosetta]EGD72631.1 hypothetical protein PTSG_04366 [Salpingoeca rosetta]|eukprot:XP_004994454.1 hypothetical protein PTSG_04366 [Salpingoeca rosetta]
MFAAEETSGSERGMNKTHTPATQGTAPTAPTAPTASQANVVEEEARAGESRRSTSRIGARSRLHSHSRLQHPTEEPVRGGDRRGELSAASTLVMAAARVAGGMALAIAFVYLILTPPTPVASALACQAKEHTQTVVDPVTGEFVCVCEALHACVLRGPSKATAFCGAGNMDVGSTPLDRLPAGCQECECEAVPSELLAEITAPRLILASIPRSGNSWMRQLLELSCGLATETVFPEGYKAPLNGVGEDEEIHADHIPGSDVYGYPCGRSNYCTRVSLPQPGVMRLVKTHAPFLSSRHAEQGVLISDAGVGAVLLLPIRNPLYYSGLMVTSLCTTLYHRGSRKIMYRFEDMVALREPLLGFILEQSGLWTARRLSGADVCFALDQPRLRPRPKDKSRASEEHFAMAWAQYARSDIEAALRHTASLPLLEHFGYAALYRAWLQRMDSEITDGELRTRVQALWHVTRARLYPSFYTDMSQHPSLLSPFNCTY